MPVTPAIETLLTAQDRQQLNEHGIAFREIERRLAALRHGVPFARLKRPCVLDDGIQRLNPSDAPTLLRHYERARAAGRITQFVPASGAATRMFHALQACRLTTAPARVSASDQRVLRPFLSGLPKFAFYGDLANALDRQGCRMQSLIAQGDARPILDALLHSPGLRYAALPKGLLAFHRYAESTRTPIEEHLIDAAACVKDDQGRVRLHLTVSPEHRETIQRHIERACRRLARRAAAWHVSCSMQHPATDTIAFDRDNRPFHDSRGHLLFRPAGHGALLSNLHALGGDLVCIKNIDNVVPDHLKATPYYYHKTLGGLLVGLQDTLFAFLSRLASDSPSSALLKQATEWARHTLALSLPDEWDTFAAAQRTQWLFTWLNRPLRVCGMVPHAGEPGGGPFWMERTDGVGALQIVEDARVNPDSPRQQDILKASTHFNPVALACGVRDYRGRPFDLHRFADHDAGWLSQKSHEGRPVKVMERSGLWNGAMATWHSVFVEIPRCTFNPVKTVLDLLRPAHQPPERA